MAGTILRAMWPMKGLWGNTQHDLGPVEEGACMSPRALTVAESQGTETLLASSNSTRRSAAGRSCRIWWLGTQRVHVHTWTTTLRALWPLKAHCDSTQHDQGAAEEVAYVSLWLLANAKSQSIEMLTHPCDYSGRGVASMNCASLWVCYSQK